MENNENNNLNELEQLKEQYETLKEQFDQQEIVNDRLMKSSIKSNVNFYMRYRWNNTYSIHWGCLSVCCLSNGSFPAISR